MPVLRPITAAAHITGRHPTLIRRWIRAGLLTAACDPTTRAVLVDLTELAHLSGQRQTRRSSAPSRKPPSPGTSVSWLMALPFGHDLA